MVGRLPRYVQAKRVKGKLYVYFRRGSIYRRIDARPASAEFATRYAELLAMSSDDAPRSSVTPGTVQALIADFKASARFRSLAPHTAWTYAKHLDRLSVVGNVLVTEVRRRHIRALRDKLAYQPRTADVFVTACGSLFKHAIDADIIDVNPAHDINRLARSVAYKVWTEAQRLTFEEAARADAIPRWAVTAYMLARYIGSRRANVLRIGWAHYDGARIAYQPAKGGEAVDIPCPAPLKTYLDALPRAGLLFVLTPTGLAWEARNFTKAFRAVLDGLGLNGLHLHGLRHTMASEMAEAGASADQIRSITGHRTTDMAERYTRQARKRALADGAVALVHGTGTEQESGKPPAGSGKRRG